MASGRKSLSDFHGHSWSSWSEYAGNTLSTDDDDDKDGSGHGKQQKKYSDAKQLFSADMEKFGLFPETDSFCTVVCNECNALVKPQGLLKHMRVRHKELLPVRVCLEKVNKLCESTDIKSTDKSSAKYMLNEKLMSKLVLNDKTTNKTLANEKITTALTDKHTKSTSDKTGSKHSSDKVSSKSNSNKQSGDKSSKSLTDKIKLQGDKTSPLNVTDKRSESEKLSKSVTETQSKQYETTGGRGEKSSKLNEDQPIKSSHNDIFTSKPTLFEVKGNAEKNSPFKDKFLSKLSEKVSVKSVLSEKLLSKAAASEKGLPNEKPKGIQGFKGEAASKNDRVLAKPIMKSLLKEKVSKADNNVPNIVPGSSLLRPLSSQDKDVVLHCAPVVAATTLSPPILTPQNRTPERHQLATDMPVLSRKRKYRERKAAPTLYDPDRHCGVWCDYFNKFCVRSLTCKVHSVALRRAVGGRSKPFDQLLLEHRRAKEDQRLAREEQDETSEASPLLSERVLSPSEPSGSPFASPTSSPSASSAHSLLQGTTCNADDVSMEEPATALITPSLSTQPPTPLPSYQYPPYPPPLPTSPSPSLPENTPSLSPFLQTPLLNVALPSLGSSHAPRPPDFASSSLKSKMVRASACEINRLQLNKGKQFNIKHGAFPPKPLRTCLFQGRKSSGMFLTQRQLEAIRTGFRMSIVKGAKSVPLSHLPLSSSPTVHIMTETAAPASISLSSVSNNDSSVLTQGSTSSSQVNASSGLKSVLNTICATKAVINPGDLQQRVPRTQKLTILPTSSQRNNLSNVQASTIPSVRLPVSASAGAAAQGVLRVPVSLKAVLPKPSPSSAPVRYTIAARENGQFHVPNILTASRVRTEEPKLVSRTGSAGQTRLKPDHVIGTLMPHITAPMTVAISNGPEPSSAQTVTSEAVTAVPSEKLAQGVRIAVPTTVPQQITYLTTTTPVTFQQVPIINSQVLSQLQLQSKGSGGTLKLLSAGGGARTLLVHQDQDGSSAES